MAKDLDFVQNTQSAYLFLCFVPFLCGELAILMTPIASPRATVPPKQVPPMTLFYRGTIRGTILYNALIFAQEKG